METFEIGGRTLQLVGEGTARHDAWVMRQIAACGLNTVKQQGEEETDEEFQFRLYKTALQTGDIFMLLGGLLVPVGTAPTAWTREMATETGNFLGETTDPADKAKLRILLVSALLPFFLSGRRSSKTSPRYSRRPANVSATHIASVDTQTTATGV
jgi:hypothetical protein